MGRSKTAGPTRPDLIAAGPPVAAVLLRIAKALAGSLFLLAALPGWAGPLEDAGAAYQRGDHATAVRLYQALANQGDGYAQSKLGSMYLQGQGTRRDYGEALKWFRRAAALGFADAQFNLGNIYLRELGVDQDLLAAARWYSRAAEQGHAQAQFTLAVLYLIGGGVKKNTYKAAYWFERAATQGHPGAQAELGNMYSSGRGVPRDAVTGYKWLTLARANAPTPSLRAKATTSLSRIAADMTPAQIKEAQRQAREWRPMPSKGGQP